MKEKIETVEKELLTDEEIVELYWQRQERAIKETDRKYGNYLHTIAYNIIHDNLDCEECLNDTYMGTWERIPPARPNMFRAFLSNIMRNIALDRFRKNRASRRIPSELVTSLEELDECIPTQSLETEYFIKELGRLLNGFIGSLTSREEFVFVCRYYYSDKISEIAKLLGMSEKTVSRDLAEIRKNLRELLEKEGYKYE
ncbi:MAG: sigma-70 family RNA polymerase sigma factor [Clostridia bacterium]|nr:sigma-70 family RNA polymerase sigma factor [Clostridia bacterium]